MTEPEDDRPCLYCRNPAHTMNDCPEFAQLKKLEDQTVAEAKPFGITLNGSLLSFPLNGWTATLEALHKVRAEPPHTTYTVVIWRKSITEPVSTLKEAVEKARDIMGQLHDLGR